jgi:hypothetical protein
LTGKTIDGRKRQISLTDFIKRAEIAGITSQLNPRFVAEMMGYPLDWTELPFQSGEQKA